MVDNARRGFLTGAFLTAEGREDIDRQAKPAGVAPPWIAGLCSVDVCASCEGHCVAACEAGVVARHEEGHAFEGVPWLDFSAAACTWCGACAEACPIDGVVYRQGDRPTLGRATLDIDACFAWKSIVCVSCRFACSDAAIVVDARNRPSIKADACTGCGACVAVCPQQAIAVSNLEMAG